MRIKTSGKIIIFLLVCGLVFGAIRFWNRIAPGAADSASGVPNVGNIGSQGPNNSGAGANVPMPGSEAGCTNLPEVRLLGYAWNAQMGLHFANGGAQATKGSLMCQHGVNLKFIRQDDNGKMQEALVAFATELSQGNAQPGKGAHFVTIMGDGGAAFLTGVNDLLKKLGPDYTAKVVGAVGFSRGEDKLMGPPSWKASPGACRGSVVAGVLRDGDWNIAQKWLSDNNLKNNPDEKTYDPDAMNWVNASDYIDAAQKYITGYSEDRPVVRNGHRTGETKHLTVNGVVTWTPGDVNIAEQKGGLVSIASTKEYSSQMPCVLIGIDKWMRSNRPIVEGLLQAACEGGDAVKSNPNALHRAAEVSATVYAEQNHAADYWEKYYKGIQETDKTGVGVDLGGSYANNLADTLYTFGLAPGSANLFAATYKVFGDVVVSQYPSLMARYAPAEAITDMSYLQDLMKNANLSNSQLKTAAPVYAASTQPVKPISRKAWNIHFETGRAAFSPDAAGNLERLSRELLVASGAVVEIHGHTDDQGNADSNMKLSEARAFAVKTWLQNRFPSNFPNDRVRVIAHGQQMPIVPNSTPEGRAQNRRVEIVVGTAD